SFPSKDKQFDIDRHDAITVGDWMPESEELTYGVFADIEHSATIIARIEPHPSDPPMLERRLMWDPRLLSVNGITDPGYLILTGGGNEELTVKPLSPDFVDAFIYYEVGGVPENVNTPFGHPLVGGVQIMDIVGKKAVIDSAEFT